jgi:lysine 2,3-aminomutase
VTESCGGFCRYCFRKRLFLSDIDEVTYDVYEGVEYIRNHPEVNNVLLTGGDPMFLSTARIKRILDALREIEHVKIIRIGTKMPAFNPYRFINDPELMRILKGHSHPDKRIYFMCHFDHPRELTGVCRESIRLLQQAGVICVNQNPILRGISDNPSVIAELWNELSYIGIPQYYVFQGRPTEGNEPFEIPIVEAYFKIEEAKKKCSGLAKRARYVMSHESGKIEIIGVDYNYIYLKYHRAKAAGDEQRLIVCYRDDQASWLDQLKPVDGYLNDYFDGEEEYGAA